MYSRRIFSGKRAWILVHTRDLSHTTGHIAEYMGTPKPAAPSDTVKYY